MVLGIPPVERRRAARFSSFTRGLVVGVSEYGTTGLPTLPACAGEASRIAAVLTDPHGCAIPPENVTKLLDERATPASLHAALESLTESCGRDDVLLFYFAGHGVSQGNGFTLCTGTGDTIDGLSSECLNETLGRLRARGAIVIVDCCGGAAIAERAPEFFRTLSGDEFRLLISASRAEQSSWEAEGYGSLFTQRLLIALSGGHEVADQGRIWFTDLFAYLHTSVLADSRRTVPATREQEPVFAGLFGADPLLFLHKDATLEDIRVRTRRVTREELRHRVRQVGISLTAAAALCVGGYWAYLDGHQYLELRGDEIALIHGVPDLSGFGLPQALWHYPFGPGDLISDRTLAEGHTITFERGENPEDRLSESLARAHRASLDLWRDDVAAARRHLSEVIAVPEALEPADLLVLPDVVRPEDAEWLEASARVADPERKSHLVTALGRLDADRAARVMADTDAFEWRGYALNQLAIWDHPCTEAAQAWLDGFGADPNNASLFPSLALAYVRTGCKAPPDAMLAVINPEHIEDAANALRLTDPEAARLAAEQLLAEIESADVLDPDIASIAFKYATHLGVKNIR